MEFAGIWILIWIALVLILTTLLFALNVSITRWNVLIPTAIVLGWVAWITYHRRSTNTGWLGLVILLTTVVLSIALSGWFYDISWDGMDYHQKAVIRLEEGFNPIHQTAEPQQIYYNMWLNHYPKGPWIFEAGLYALTGNIETGKGLHLILMFSAFFVWLAVVLRSNWIAPWAGVWIAALLAFNPVSIYQSLSFYIDGLVSTSIVLLIGLMISIYQNGNRFELTGLASTVIIGLNIKFTGTAYIALFGLALFLALWIAMKDARKIRRIFIYLATSVLVGILIVGFNPYVINTVHYGHPLYPVYGSKSFNKDYIMGGGVLNFRNKSPVQKFLLATLSKTDDSAKFKYSFLKIPFQVSRTEIKESGRTDVRFGGFGPWFSGALVLSILGLEAAFIIDWRKAGLMTLMLVLIGGSMILSDEYWWARYAPQFWMVPVVVAALLLLLKPKLPQIMGIVLATVLTINLIMVSGSFLVTNYKLTREIDMKMVEISRSGKVYQFDLGPLTPWTVRFDKYHISYIIVPAGTKLSSPKQFISFFYQPLN